LPATVLKVLLILLPVVVIIVIAATAISAAISAYSTAVTPDSSFTREARNWIIADRDLGFIRVRFRQTLLI
jgi:hypothetical protein